MSGVDKAEAKALVSDLSHLVKRFVGGQVSADEAW